MTTNGYGITGIGLNPLGNWGLGMSGQFSAYDSYMPSLMAPYYSTAMSNPMFAAGYGVYDPTYYAKMQQEMEKSQALHNGAMHKIMVNNDINAHQETDIGLIQKIITNGDVKAGVQTLYTKVKEGDQDGVCAEYDKLYNAILNKYRDEFKAMGTKCNPSTSARECIEHAYSSITGSKLMDDIKRHGDSSFMNGFMSTFREGHHDRYVDETLNHIYGTPIDQKEHKDMKSKIGSFLGYPASALEKGVYGAGLAMTGTGIGIAGLKGFNQIGSHYIEEKTGKKLTKDWFGKNKHIFEVGKNGEYIIENGERKLVKGVKEVSGSCKWIKNIKWGKNLKKAGIIGIAAGIALDIWWKSSKN